ncbi:DUF262 domain-containing protein [Alicyclobacillus acidoterrestris]|uniref:DUF262 domain-containing protein n=1 Tax=Alicyclobacillus acidoterrestris (strain ATCC 49025 / DSM 3922 / CIP 106132 / NCIMB 13137 / GD3B) TaxID=1356854 RepID=T0BUJ6_ALIAG|nr:DUF262 domain-containing protein [Alicyclobacillus acidoterrestris]EPZ44479.1 hypothetical protein N007_10975 [Alicyclobacillus acidoterrestris ATCC 49025]UNO49349.1 DUF262 domain-containing protein [Alicyclobacillus acidoterrestris]
MKTTKSEQTVESLLRGGSTQISTDLVIQRKEDIWDRKRKSLLIHSMLMGYPIPSLFFAKEGDTFHVLDGKQRLTSIQGFVDDKYALSTSIPEISDLAGKKFSKLDKEQQQKILEYRLDLTVVEDLTEEEMEELFVRWNNGMPLVRIETTRVILGQSVHKFIREITEMPFFKEKVKLSNANKRRCVDEELVLQILALVSKRETGFSGNELKEFAKELRKDDVKEELRADIQNACHDLNKAFSGEEEFLKKLHVPMIFKLVLDMQEINRNTNRRISPKQFGEFVVNFWNNRPEEYKNASMSGSARKENVQKRLSIMTQAFEEHFGVQVKRDVPTADEEVAASVEAVEEQGE